MCFYVTRKGTSCSIEIDFNQDDGFETFHSGTFLRLLGQNCQIIANRVRNYFAIFSADGNFSFCTSGHPGNNSVKVPFSKTDYFPDTVVPCGLEEMVEKDYSPGEQAENSLFQPLLLYLWPHF